MYRTASEGKTAEASSIFAQVKQTIAAQRRACRQDAANSPFARPLSKHEQADLTLTEVSKIDNTTNACLSNMNAYISHECLSV